MTLGEPYHWDEGDSQSLRPLSDFQAVSGISHSGACMQPFFFLFGYILLRIGWTGALGLMAVGELATMG